ncbi:hypothetical protein PG990_009755 [Apiospora arundinis]
MASWLSRMTPTERREDPLKKLGEVSQEKLGKVSQGKPQLEQGFLSDKLNLAKKQAQIMSANDSEENSEKETQQEHLVRHINQLTKSGSPEPHAEEDGKSKGNGKAAACDWKGDPAEPQYDDLASQHNIPDHAELCD